MINKYTIDLMQFNNGESDRITFPTFDQCLMYGLHKLKKALANNKAVIKAVLMQDTHGRKIVVSPSEEELESLISISHNKRGNFKIKTTLDGDDIDMLL